LRDAQPLGQQHRNERAEERPEEEAGAAHDHHHEDVEGQDERERGRIDELDQGRVEHPRDAADRRADGKRHERVAAGVDAEREGADRVLP
jgi:hypothetical protein